MLIYSHNPSFIVTSHRTLIWFPINKELWVMDPWEWGNGLTACLPRTTLSSRVIHQFVPISRVRIDVKCLPYRCFVRIGLYYYCLVCWCLYLTVYVMVSVLASFSSYSIICHFPNSVSLSLYLFSLSLSLSIDRSLDVIILLSVSFSLYISFSPSLSLSFSPSLSPSSHSLCLKNVCLGKKDIWGLIRNCLFICMSVHLCLD